MSRVGKQAITIPSGVEVKVQGNIVLTKGSKGELKTPMFDGITFEQDGDQLNVKCTNESNKRMKSQYGLFRALLANSVKGVSTGFEVVLELHGVGYRSQVQGKALNLSLGFSHPVNYPIPEGVEMKVDQNRIHISGADRQRIGQVAAEIRSIRSPEPYKGKGVRYQGERIVMKEGKKA